MLVSPYINHPESEWLEITKKLIQEFPLSSEVLISIVESAWEDLYNSSFGNSGLKIGQDIFLPAQEYRYFVCSSSTAFPRIL